MTDEELFELVQQTYADANINYLAEQTAKACEYCQNNPKNGGSGICHCILGQAVIY